VVVQTEQEPQTAGELIRFWRTRRGLSQLELSLYANVSTKHLSFVETGRSSPSRQLVNLFERWETQAAVETLCRSAPSDKQGAATRSVSVAEYDIADVRPVFGKGRA
jgi:transcriptional regulator with XRE-family HTH domain